MCTKNIFYTQKHTKWMKNLFFPYLCDFFHHISSVLYFFKKKSEWCCVKRRKEEEKNTWKSAHKNRLETVIIISEKHQDVIKFKFKLIFQFTVDFYVLIFGYGRFSGFLFQFFFSSSCFQFVVRRVSYTENGEIVFEISVELRK